MGFVGTKYATSRITELSEIPNKYGYRGITLASLVDVSECLIITSRHSGSDATWIREYRKGTARDVRETVARPSHGTTVEVKGLLYNLGIQRNIINPKAELQEIKIILKHAAICHPGVSFSLRDHVKSNVIVKIPRSKDIFQTMQSVYGFELAENIQELQIEKNDYKVEAYIGMTCIEDQFQIIYLNGRSLLNSKLQNIMNANLSNVFATRKEACRIMKVSIFKEETEIKRTLNPFYIVKVHCPYTAYDMSQKSNSTLLEFYNWTSVTAILKRLCKVFEESLQSAVTIPNQEDPSDKKRHQIEVTDKNKDQIQEKVASIVEKILKSNPKKLQGYNEVNGKPAKRRNKAALPKKFKLDKIFCPNKSKNAKLNKLSLESVKPTRKPKEEGRKNGNISKCQPLVSITKQTTKSNTTKNKNTSNNEYDKLLPVINDDKNLKNGVHTIHLQKRISKAVCLPKKVTSKRFETVQGSVQQRCKKLSTNVTNLMKKYNTKSIHKKCVTMKKFTTTTSTTVKNIVQSIQKTSGRLMVSKFIPFPKNYDRTIFLQKYFKAMFKNQQEKQFEVKSRYDLLKTVIENIPMIKNNNAEVFGKEKDMPLKNYQISNDELLLQNIVKTTNKKHNKINKSKEIKKDLVLDFSNHQTYQSHRYDENVSNALINQNHQKSVYKSKPQVTFGKFAKRNSPESLTAKVENLSIYRTTNQSANLFSTDKRYHTIRKSCPKFHQQKLHNIIRNEADIVSNNTETLYDYNFNDKVNKSVPLTLNCQNLQEAFSDCLSGTKITFPPQEINDENEISSLVENTDLICHSYENLNNAVSENNNKALCEGHQVAYNRIGKQSSVGNITAKFKKQPQTNVSINMLSCIRKVHSKVANTNLDSKFKNPFLINNISNKLQTSHSELLQKTSQNMNKSDYEIFDDVLDTISDYNFDDEVNKPIALSLTQQELPEVECLNNTKITSPPQNYNDENEIYSLTVGANNNSNFNQIYTIDTPSSVIINTNEIISETSLSIVNIRGTMAEIRNDNRLLFQNLNQSVEKPIFSEPLSLSYKFRYLYEGNNPAVNDRQFTFASNSYSDENVVIVPSDVCEVIIGSSDVLESETVHLDNFKIQSNSQNIEQLRIADNEDNFELVAKINQKKRSRVETEVHMKNYDTEVKIALPLNEELQNKEHDLTKDTVKSLVFCSQFDVLDNLNEMECNDRVEDKSYIVDKKRIMCSMDVNNGMTSIPKEIVSDSNFNIKRRPSYVPKGLSPIFLNEKVYDKRNLVLPSQECYTKSMYEMFAENVEKCAEVYQADVQNLVEPNKAGTKFRKLNASIVFDNVDISSAKVLQQIDNKFIACLMNGKSHSQDGGASYMVLFDQHAVHERIRLEQLMKDYKTDAVWKSSSCEFTLELSEEELFYIKHFAHKFREIGMNWSVEADDENYVRIRDVPTAVLGKHGRKMEAVVNATKMIIREHVETIKCMKNAAGVPRALTDLVNMEACRFAVKFGDRMTVERCKRLVFQLSGCSVPFQCAHGRPDLAVLFRVHPERRPYTIDVAKMKSRMIRT